MSVPIVIDSVKNFPTFAMTRCSYFAIENTDIGDEWQLQRDNTYLNFFMIGLEGVVISPVGDSQTFDSVERIEELFFEIENYSNLSVEMNHIWVPNAVFGNRVDDLFRGQVFRINEDLFNIFFHFGDESSTHEILLNHVRREEMDLFAEYSPNETSALMEWNNREIEMIKKHYRTSDKRLQKKIEDDENPDPVAFA